jgi:two-component system response regulator RegA
MNLSGQSSLPFISLYRKQLPTAKIILVTGYASIASTVTAIKSGADDYLPKPLEFKKLVTLIAGTANPKVTEHAELDLKKPSPERLEWEYIQQALNDNQGNVSETARQLNMHRRTLQRKLAKKTVTK